MNGHKLVADNHDHFVLRHPSGTEFQVAKNGLSAPMVAQIAKMPAVAHDDDGTQPDSPTMAADAPPADEAATSTDTGNTPATEASPTPTAGASGSWDAPPASQPSYGVLQSNQNTPGMADTAGQYLTDMEGAMGSAKAANAAKAGAEGQAANDTKAAADKMIADQQAANTTYTAKIADLDAKSDALYKEVAGGKIDPNHLWSTVSTGGKLAMLAGILISGAGANAGQGNGAMGVINKAIDNDIDAQKANLANKQNLLHYNLQRSRDLTAAQSETRLNLLAVFKGQVEAAAARQGSAVAMANAQALNAQIDMQMAGIKQQVAQQHAMWRLATSQGAAAGAGDPNDIDPQALRTSFLLGKAGYPNGIPEKAQAQAMKEYGAFKRNQGVQSTLDQNFTTMEQNHGVGIGNGPLASEAKKKWEAAANIVGMTVDHELAGRVTDTTLEALKENNLPRWGDSPSVAATKRNAVKDAIKAANAKEAEGYGTLMTYGKLSPDNPTIAPSTHIVKQGRKIQ